jgi:PAS domain S-box-containing protein
LASATNTEAQPHSHQGALAFAGDAVVTVDTGGQITSWNRAAERILGHTGSEAVGQTLALLVPPEHRPRHIAAFHAAMESGSLANDGRPARIEAMTASGETIPLVMSLGLLSGSDRKPSGAVAILRSAAEPISFI